MTDTVHTLPTAEQLAERLATATASVETVRADLQDALRAALYQHLIPLRTAIARRNVARDNLLDHVTAEGSAAYPKGARSQTAHGITWGWQQSQPKVEVPDHDASIRAAREHYSEADVEAILIRKETIRVSAIEAWRDADLAKILAERTPAEDKPFVRGAVDDVEKLAKAIGDKAIKQIGEAA
jgi:hypothetical protein